MRSTNPLNTQIPQMIPMGGGGSANNDSVADSIIMSTLLNSIRTNNPIIDALTSLVVTSKFRSNLSRNFSIVITLFVSTVMSRISNKIDILMYLYNLRNLYNFKNPFVGKNNEVLMKSYINCDCFDFEIREKYTILAIFFKILEDKDISRIKIKKDDYLFSENSSEFRNLCGRTFYGTTKYEKNIKTDSIDVITCPPESEKWYKLDDDIWVIYTIVNRKKNKKEEKDKNGNDNRNSSSQNNSNEHYYHITIHSKNKQSEEITKYIVNLQNKLMIKYVKYNNKIREENRLELLNITEKNYRGKLVEINMKYDKISKTSVWHETVVNKFCRPFDSVFFNEKGDFNKTLNQFILKSGIYDKLPHKHKMGIMLYGDPGSGKSSLATSIATKLKRNVVRINLKDDDMSDKKLAHIFNNYCENWVIILDELDTCEEFRPRQKDSYYNNGGSGKNNSNNGNNNGTEKLLMRTILENYNKRNKKRKHRKKKEGPENNKDKNSDYVDDDGYDSEDTIIDTTNTYKKLHLGNFLELLDGVSFSSGRVVIAMTNHPELLDPAILRPGRFDTMIHMKPLDLETLKQYIHYVFENLDISEEELNEAAVYSDKHHVKSAILEQACVERYGNDAKTLVEHIAYINSSFKINDLKDFYENE